MPERENHIQHLFTGELQSRLASSVRLSVTGKRQPLDLPMEWTHGQHRVRYEEIALATCAFFPDSTSSRLQGLARLSQPLVHVLHKHKFFWISQTFLTFLSIQEQILSKGNKSKPGSMTFSRRSNAMLGLGRLPQKVLYFVGD